MTTFFPIYQKLRLLKLPIVAVLLVLLWVGITGLVVLVDVFNQHGDLHKLYEINRLSQSKVLQISLVSISFGPQTPQESLKKQKSQIEIIKKELYPSNLVTQFDGINQKWPKLKEVFQSDQVKLTKTLDNNLIKLDLQLCQGSKISQINQLLQAISKTEIKPYSKANIGELENSFASIKSNLKKAIELNQELLICYQKAGSGFITKDNLFSLIRSGNYLLGIDQLYSRLIETLKAEDRPGLATALDMIKAVDINNIITLKSDFGTSLEAGKNTILNKNIQSLVDRQAAIRSLQSFLKSNVVVNS